MSTSTGWVLRTLVVLALVAGLAALTVGVHAQDDGGERNANREVPDYDIAIDCAYDPGDDRTECTFGARAGPGTKDVGHLDVPDAVACAAVVGGDYEAIDPDPNTGVIGFKSKGGRGQLMLILVGEVAVEGTATYAIKSGDGVFRVPGPGLICGDDPVDAAQGGSPE